MEKDDVWKVKTLAFIHDPAEKALILLRGKGHEAGTVAHLTDRLLGDEAEKLRSAITPLRAVISRGDRFAAGADRLSLPMGYGAQVVFAREPQLIHPLTGKKFTLSSLEQDVPVEVVEAVSFDHFQELVIRENGSVNWKKTFLAFWRFGPELAAKGLEVLWKQLPADTRSPDHTIWEHLSLSSAFAGAMAEDPEGCPALLLMSFGPVQDFIAQARSVSDLWAGSHLLSRISWEAMKVICEAFGPDAVLFPDLHGVAAVDVWLKGILGEALFEEKLWMTERTDANPLFGAAFPNRFVAVVPKRRGAGLAEEIRLRVRRWVKERAGEALRELLEIAGENDAGDARGQIERQFEHFPEVSWAIIPWDLAGKDALQDEKLRETLNSLGADAAYLPHDVKALLTGELRLQNVSFYTPNAGVAYAGLYEALERAHACAKNIRPFEGTMEEGYRCSLCGEREWLTPKRGDASKGTGIFAPTQKRGETIWVKVSKKYPSIAKEGEHLCGICALKRLWPRVFVEECKDILGGQALRRFVLSTHAMALSTSIRHFLEELKDGMKDALNRMNAHGELSRMIASLPTKDEAALPRRLHRLLRERYRQTGQEEGFFRRIPVLLDERDREADRERIRSLLQEYLGVAPETYYGLILMDGDEMGAWLSGAKLDLPMGSRFHDKTFEHLRGFGELDRYLNARRWVSPGYHQAVSTALNAFALGLARPIVEDLFMGKLIYAGGDDLLAMASVHDLPQLMFALRCAFSGELPVGVSNDDFWTWLGTERDRIILGNGFALVHQGKRRELLRLMGTKATASMGAVIAHHQAPLGRVLTVLRRAERRAKDEGGRDAFSLTIMKRSGGTESFLGKWKLDQGWAGSDMGLLLDLRRTLAFQLSRRSAYTVGEIIPHLPSKSEALRSVLAYHFRRQARVKGKAFDELAERLAERGEKDLPWLRSILFAAEFLAREGRIASDDEKEGGE